MDKREISLIFCLAPAKIGMTLECYEEELRQNRHVYILLPLSGLFEFFKKLKLKADVIFTKDYELKYSNNEYFKIKKNVRSILRLIDIDRNTDVRVFFTDWVTNSVFMGLYLKELNKYPQAILHDQASRDYMIPLGGKYINRKGLKPIHYVKEIVYSLIYGYHYKYSWTESFYILCLDIDYYQYKEIDSKVDNIYKRYQVPLNIDNGKVALLFTEPYRFEFQTKDDYDKLNLNIVKNLKDKGYKVIMKGHPRLGNHPLLEDICDYIIPAYIPSEFLDLTSVEFVIGFVSNSICQATKYTKAYSVLPMCEVVNKDIFDYFCKLVNANGEGRVKMLCSFDDIESV